MPKSKGQLPKLDPRSLPGPETIFRDELDNGIVVLARKNGTSPSVVISGYLSVGSLDEPAEMAGLADMTASALMRGTQTRKFREIYESLESIGANLGISAGAHTTSFHGKSLAEDLPLLLELLADVLRHPLFPKAQVEQLRAEKLTSLAIRDQDTRSQASMAFDDLAYPDHPYSQQTDGYPETVSQLTPANLRSFHRKRFGPRGMVISIVGAVEPKRTSRAVAKVLGGWSLPRQPARPDLPPVTRLTGLARKEVQLQGKSQSDIVLGVVGPSRFEPDYLAASLGNNILGRFGLMGRIGDSVRERSGLAYYAYSVVNGGPGPGPWHVVAGVNPANVQRAIDLVLEELRRFVTRRVTALELFENQSNYIGQLPLQLESNEGVASALVHIERYQLGLDYYQRYASLIQAVTRGQILETARRFLDPDNLAIAVAGPMRARG